jgi:putative toxin-antitoxin system antitoxin component (TIGR02293 family)
MTPMAVPPARIAEILGLPRPQRGLADVWLGRKIAAGLPARALERVAAQVGVDHRVSESIVPRATWARRRRTGRLSAAEGAKLERLARAWVMALDVMGSAENAREFLSRAHPLLGGEVPLDLIATEPGTRAVEQVLGRLKYGSAA